MQSLTNKGLRISIITWAIILMIFNHWSLHITQVKTTTTAKTMQWSIMSCVDHNAFLSESESRNLSLLYHFGGDSTLVPQILNVRNWSSKDFDKDCDQFAWGEIRETFTNFHEIQLSLTLSSKINLTCLHQQLTSCF